MKKVKNILLTGIILILLFAFLIPPYIFVFADEEIDEETNVTYAEFNDILNELLDELNLENLEVFFNEYVKCSSLEGEIQKAINGEYIFDFSQIYSMVLQIFMSNVKSFAGIVISIIAIVILSGILQKSSSTKSRLTDVVFVFSYSGVAILLFAKSAEILNQVNRIFCNISAQSESIFPILLTLVSISGGNSSVKVMNPICVFVTNGIMQIVTKVLFPIISIIFVTNVIAGLSEKFSLKNLRDFFCDCFKWIVGIGVAIFSFFVTVNAFGSSTFDGITLRTLKYTIGNTVPIIGSFAKDGVDIIVASSVLIKNAVGGIVVTIIFAALLIPLLTVVGYSLILKLLSGIIESFADKRICDLVTSFSKAVSLIGILLIMVFVVYLITIFMIICAQSAIFS